MFQISLNCCAHSGTTFDTQILHSKEPYTFGMYNLTKCQSYVAIDFSAVFKPENQDERNVSQNGKDIKQASMTCYYLMLSLVLLYLM